MPDEPTLGEVYRLTQDIRDDVRTLGEKVDGLKQERLPARVERLENALTWVARIVIACVIAALMSLVLVSGGGLS